MTPEQLKEYLKNWMNKAVHKGGFNAQEAHDGLEALRMLYDATEGEKAPEKPLKTK